MYVSKEHLKDVFGTDDFKKIGTVPMVTVEYASNEKLMDLVDEARANNNFKGELALRTEQRLHEQYLLELLPLAFHYRHLGIHHETDGGGSPTGGKRVQRR